MANSLFAFVFESGRHLGVAELLEVYGAIVSGFSLPLAVSRKSNGGVCCDQAISRCKTSDDHCDSLQGDMHLVFICRTVLARYPCKMQFNLNHLNECFLEFYLAG